MSSPFYLVDHDIQYSLFSEPDTQPNILNQKRANKILHIYLLVQFETLWNKKRPLISQLSVYVSNLVFVNSYVLTIFIAFVIEEMEIRGDVIKDTG